MVPQSQAVSGPRKRDTLNSERFQVLYEHCWEEVGLGISDARVGWWKGITIFKLYSAWHELLQ